jgi:hypothetical protein
MREQRIHTALPVRVTLADAGRTTSLNACTIDVSQKGARLIGLAGVKAPGELIAIRRKASEAQFRVIWIGKPQTPHEGQVGVECVDTDKVIWDVDFAKVHEDFEPLSTSQKPGEKQPPRYSCEGRVLIWSQREDRGGFEAELQAIGPSFCEFKSATSFQGPLLLQVYTEDTQMTVKGIAREASNGRSLVDFTEIRRGDRLVLQNLISRLSRKSSQRSEPVNYDPRN